MTNQISESEITEKAVERYVARYGTVSRGFLVEQLAGHDPVDIDHALNRLYAQGRLHYVTGELWTVEPARVISQKEPGNGSRLFWGVILLLIAFVVLIFIWPAGAVMD
jgi:hypothetical protein